jgi:drug/metabolite transporter (DMT)-like permease
MLAALCYVTTGICIRKINNMKPDMLVACSLLMATVVMVPLSLMIDRPWRLWQQDQVPGATAIGAILYLGIIPTAVAFFLRAKIVMSVGYTFFSMAGYLVPVFAVIFGALILNEIVEIQAIIALTMVLCGIGIAQIKPKQ